MEGKYSLKHIYNKGRSTQMSPQEFIKLMTWLDENANGQIDESIEVTEKIDGCSNFVGYDGRIFVETFGFDKKFYDESDFTGDYWERKAKALLEIAHTMTGFEDVCEELCEENNCASVKVQLETLITKMSKSEDYCQIVLIPYELSKLAKDGNGFIIQVLNGETLKPVKNEKESIQKLCKVMTTDTFKVTGTNPKHFDPIDIKEDIQQVKDIVYHYTQELGKDIDVIMTSRKRADLDLRKEFKAAMEEVQEALQDKLAAAFPSGDYGDYYEGLVFKLTNGMMFKITSKKFKHFMAEHNHWSESIETNKITNFFKQYLEVDGVKEELNKIFGVRDTNEQLIFQKIDNGGIAKISLYDGENCIPFDKELKRFEVEFLNGADITKLPFTTEFALASGHPSVSFTEEGKSRAIVKLLKTGGASGEMYKLNLDTCKLESLGMSKKSAAGDKTPIQELFTGIVLDKLLRDELTSQEEIEEFVNDLKNKFITAKDSQPIIISGRPYSYNGTVQSLKATTKNAIDDEWISSFKSLKEVDFSLLKNTESLNFDNYIFMHGTVTEPSISHYTEVSNDLFTKDLYSSSVAQRDTVNPSDIYFIDKSKTDVIVQAFETMKNRKTFIADWTEFLKSQNEEPGNEYWKDFETLTKIQKFAPEELYTFIHNYLLSKKYIIGISLKKIVGSGHFTFTGGEHFFLEKSNFLITSHFVIDMNNFENSTITDYYTTWGISGSEKDKTTQKDTRGFSQGALYIRANAKGEDLSSEKGPITIKLAIRTSGTNIPSIESTIEGSGAQGGKGKNGLQLLVGKKVLKFSENKLLENAMISLAESGDLQHIFEDTTTMLSNGVLVDTSSITKINPELQANVEVVDKFWDKDISNEKLSARDKNIQKLSSDTMKYIKGELPLLDKSLEYIINSVGDEKKQEIFRLTLLFAKSLKYQVFLVGGDDLKVKLQNEKLNSEISAKDYFKTTFNNSVVSYFKIS